MKNADRRSSPVRTALIQRKTNETDIALSIDLDGTGVHQIQTPFPFLDHMLSAFSRHALFDVTLRATGDVHVDDHHTIEDIGIVLGEALKESWGEKRGIRRFGHATIPLDDALAAVTVDLSGRSYLVYNVKMSKRAIKSFPTDMVEHFFRSLTDHSRINLHINLFYGTDAHHILEAIFKGFGRALDMATQIDPRVADAVASTKGTL